MNNSSYRFFSSQNTLEAENKRAQVILLSGTTGPTASFINGIYDPTKERNNGRVRYVKRGDSDIWIKYNVGNWQVQQRSSDSDGISSESCVASLTALWLSSIESFAGRCSWKIWIGSCWQEQHNVNLDLGSVAEHQVSDFVLSIAKLYHPKNTVFI